MRDRYSVAVGLLFAAVIAIALVNTLGSGDEGTLGLDELPPRWALPEFAVPRAAGPLEGDANVAQDDCETSQAPCPEGARRAPACRIRTPGAIRVCDFFGRPLVLSFWFSQGGNCVAQQDVVDRVYARYRGRVGFLSLNVRDDRDSVRDPIRAPRLADAGRLRPRRGRRRPLPRRRLPDLCLRLPGRDLQDASIGELTEAQLDARVERAAAGDPRGGGGSDRGGDSRHPSRAGPGTRSRAGSRRISPRSSRASGSPGSRSTAAPARSPEPVRMRLRDLSDRFYGAHAIHMREQPIPWAYRVFFRQIGLDPDRTRTRSSSSRWTGFTTGPSSPTGMPDDALTIAIAETGVAVRAFDADRLRGGSASAIRRPGEALPGKTGELEQGTLTVADERGPSSCSSAGLARAASAATRGGSRSPRYRSRACPRPRSTRHSGSPVP